jgi:hypothetical protein
MTEKSFITLATVITIVNYNGKTFIVQATGYISHYLPQSKFLPVSYHQYQIEKKLPVRYYADTGIILPTERDILAILVPARS